MEETRKSNVYTRKGDSGQTSLVGGERVYKSDDRLNAYGAIDELNSFLALLLCEESTQQDKPFFLQIQRNLFKVGTVLATKEASLLEKLDCKITSEDIDELERWIDRVDAELPKLKKFVLPGAPRSSALAHVCRTVCRRAEREMITLINCERIPENVLIYINRLSDLFFVYARKLTLLENESEIFWE